jgi:amino acid transporter
LFDSMGKGREGTLGYLGPFLAAALMASYVMYGFDTAGALAEETAEPRRRAPWAILRALAAAALAGGLLILFGILAVSDPGLPELGRISGGLPFLVKDVLGEKLGVLLLVEVIFAVCVCALAVHAAAVRLMFAMARDNNLPFAVALSHVSPRSRAPVIPSLVVGALAAAILVANVNLPNAIEMLCSIAIVWANLAYLMVTFPLLLSRNKRRGAARVALAAATSIPQNATAAPVSVRRRHFSLGRFGLPVNVFAVFWGLFVVTNISWPRTEIYGDHPWGRFAAPLTTLALIAAGTAYYLLFQRRHTGIVPRHVAGESLDGLPLESNNQTIETHWIGRLAPGE